MPVCSGLVPCMKHPRPFHTSRCPPRWLPALCPQAAAPAPKPKPAAAFLPAPGPGSGTPPQRYGHTAATDAASSPTSCAVAGGGGGKKGAKASAAAAAGTRNIMSFFAKK